MERGEAITERGYFFVGQAGDNIRPPWSKLRHAGSALVGLSSNRRRRVFVTVQHAKSILGVGVHLLTKPL